MTRHTNPGRKGGPHDDVAQSIRNEQQRDAAPTAEEVERMHEDYLADEGCTVCDEHDPSELSAVHEYAPPCPAYQTPPPTRDDGRVFCDEHRRGNRELWWARQVQRARNQDAIAIVEYDCGSVQLATYPEATGLNATDTWHDVPPTHRPTPEVPVHCECGEPIDGVHMLTEEL